MCCVSEKRPAFSSRCVYQGSGCLLLWRRPGRRLSGFKVRITPPRPGCMARPFSSRERSGLTLPGWDGVKDTGWAFSPRAHRMRILVRSRSRHRAIVLHDDVPYRPGARRNRAPAHYIRTRGNPAVMSDPCSCVSSMAAQRRCRASTAQLCWPSGLSCARFYPLYV